MRVVWWGRAVTILGAGSMLAATVRPALAQQDSTSPSVEERLQDLDQQVRILKRQRELEQDSLGRRRRTDPG